MTRSAADVREVGRLAQLGLSQAEISRRTGISRFSVRDWLRQGIEDLAARREAQRAGTGGRGPCDGSCDLHLAVPPQPYAYLLGQYLGDGSIASHAKHVFRLRITCCLEYPDIIEEVRVAVAAVLPNRVGFFPKIGCVDVGSYSKHWPCLFPQHGPGRKHLRAIFLAEWQEAIVVAHPWEFLRGLVHSDGCRDLNPVNGKDYPRYQFSNRSAQIRSLFGWACDLVGVTWRQDSNWTVSVARREAVARMDEYIGPKS